MFSEQDDDKIDILTRKLLSKLPVQVKKALKPKLSSYYQQFQSNFAIVESPGATLEKDVSLSLRLLTSSPNSSLLITNSPERSQFLLNMCKSVDSKKTDALVTLERKLASSKQVFIADIDLVMFCLKHGYLRVFLLVTLIFDDVGSLIEAAGFQKVKNLLVLLPIETKKIYFTSKTLDKIITERLKQFSLPPPKKKQ